jgi:hypothetical protein
MRNALPPPEPSRGLLACLTARRLPQWFWERRANSPDMPAHSRAESPTSNELNNRQRSGTDSSWTLSASGRRTRHPLSPAARLLNTTSGLLPGRQTRCADRGSGQAGTVAPGRPDDDRGDRQREDAPRWHAHAPFFFSFPQAAFSSLCSLACSFSCPASSAATRSCDLANSTMLSQNCSSASRLSSDSE